MHILDEENIEFFKRALLDEIETQLKLFELNNQGFDLHRNIYNQEEFGRLKLYEDRAKIIKHFNLCEKNKRVYLTNKPSNALLGKIYNQAESASLTWKEDQGIRYEIREAIHNELLWSEEGEPPKTRLTETGKIAKRIALL